MSNLELVKMISGEVEHEKLKKIILEEIKEGKSDVLDEVIHQMKTHLFVSKRCSVEITIRIKKKIYEW